MSSDSAGVRILVVDDNPSIHGAMRKVLQRAVEIPNELDRLESELFGNEAREETGGNCFEVESAYQGQEALVLVERALAAGRPYALAFVDVRMPPGWDGIETIERIWKVDPNLQVVICTAYSDYSWSEISSRFGPRDSWLIIKKPWDVVEVVQVAHSLTRKWTLHRQVREKLVQLEALVRRRASEVRHASDRAGAMDDSARVEMEIHTARMIHAVADLAGALESKHEEVVHRIEETREFLDELFQGLLAILGPGRVALPASMNGDGPDELVPTAFATTFDGIHSLGTLIRTLIRTAEHFEGHDGRGLTAAAGEAVALAYGELKKEEQGVQSPG